MDESMQINENLCVDENMSVYSPLEQRKEPTCINFLIIKSWCEIVICDGNKKR
jgi:hypothetical protein